jgi:hypothetical protein
VARQNLCINPACKNNTTSWGGNATYARSTSLTGMPRTTGIAITGGSGFVQTPTGACSPGQVITVSFYIKNNTGGSEPSGRDVFVAYTRDGEGDTFPQSFSTAALGDDGNVQRASLTCNAAPALATGIYLVIDNLNIVGIEVTAVLYEVSGTLGTYGDGDTAGWVWDGTDGNSTSTLNEGPTPATVAAVATVGAPTIQAGAAPAPATVAVAATVGTPTLRADQTVTAATVAVAATVPAPTLSTGSTVAAATVAATATVGAPTLAAGAVVSPATVAAVATVPAPTVAAGESATATPATVAASTSIDAPTLTTGSTATPATVAVVATVGTPVVSLSVLIAPATVALVVAVGAATVSTTGSATVTAGTVTVTVSVPAPVVSALTVSPEPDLVHVTPAPFVHVRAGPVVHVRRS